MSAEPNHRLLSVTTPLGPDAFLLTGFSGREALSRLFHFDLEMLSERDPRSAADLAGRPISWAVHSPGRPPRFFHGVVRRFVAGDREVGRLRTYRAVVVPWVWVLTRGAEHRVFADRTLPEVVDAVFRDRGFSDYQFDLNRTYPRRELRVQYRESAFHFVSRLLEEEGVFYFFRHEEGKHTLVLADDPSAYRDCEEGRPRYSPGVVGRDRVSGWERRYDVSPGEWTPTDEDFEPAPGAGEAAPELAAHHVSAGSGGCCTFTPGGKFVLSGHGCEAENRGYAVAEVRHTASDPSFTAGGGGRFYENTFTCIPDSAAFRPPPATPRPTVAGPQTAVVIGPKDGDRVAAEGGRVEVRFLWGRERRAEKTTCRVRVAPSPGGGPAFRPRAGQEIVVDFLDGDPDRPLLVGRALDAEPAADAEPAREPVAAPAAVADPIVEIPNDPIPAAQPIETGDRTVHIEAGNDILTITKGDRTIRLDSGRSLTEAGQAIELRVGASVLRMEPAGITIQGMAVTIEGHALAEVKGLMTRVGADAVLAVQGGATVIG